ncbi:hypothetical protein E2C01_045257 [Portunus trituberculatus]|uniref:Uncharacterized protein n=1 Tax=Portunus trituberculatus TaxID=210409 RepID=A0A5B7G2C8_PORTR|nr:hypothetical protein [Portunus trituberculatus]
MFSFSEEAKSETGRRDSSWKSRQRQVLRSKKAFSSKPASLVKIMDPLVDFQELDLLEELEAVRVRLPRRIVQDHLDLFLTLTEEEFTSSFRLCKQAARCLLTQLHLPKANDSRAYLTCFINQVQTLTQYTIRDAKYDR